MVQIIPLVKLFGVYSAFETLYIPHGSDNTNSPIDDWLIKLLDFISHMVQIILNNRHVFNGHRVCVFISHMVQIILLHKQSPL